MAELRGKHRILWEQDRFSTTTGFSLRGDTRAGTDAASAREQHHHELEIVRSFRSPYFFGAFVAASLSAFSSMMNR
jgi:hypothetical protein